MTHAGLRCGLCDEQRGILTVFGEDLDPDMNATIEHWHDRPHPEPGPFLASPGAWPHDRGPGTAEAIDIAALESWRLVFDPPSVVPR